MKVKEDQIRELELKVQVMGEHRIFSCLNSFSMLDLCSVLRCGDGAFSNRPDAIASETRRMTKRRPDLVQLIQVIFNLARF